MADKSIARRCGVEDVVKEEEEEIQDLWAGYGSVSRISLRFANGSITTLIKKTVTPGPGKGVGHLRKVHSYEVESNFYSKHATELLKSGSRVAKPYDITYSKNKSEFILEDLDKDFPCESYNIGFTQAKAVLSWFAKFHGHFWGVESKDAGLWEQGSYWYLDTRMDELKRTRGKRWKDLVSVAGEVDKRLKGIMRDGKVDKQFRTMIHGDPKSANILFSKDGKSCALYDFQYCGSGYGARDLAYLFVSSCSSDCLQQETELLAHYHKELVGILKDKAKGYTMDVLREHFELALLDYVRFMAGWGMWGSSGWAVSRTQALLERMVKEKK